MRVQKFLIEIFHVEQPINEIDVAIALKSLPEKASTASFRIRKLE